MEYPEILYQYTSSKFAVKILQECKIKLTPPDEFNDPFEFQPQSFIPPDLMPQNKSLMKTQNYFTKARGYINFSGDINSWNDKIDNDPEFASTVAEIDKRKGLENVEKKHKQRLKEIGLACFSECNDDILMWSHYANSHKGVCLGFKVDKLIHCPNHNLMKVRYSSERVVIPIGLSAKGSVLPLGELMRTKSNHWQYEREWRFNYLFNDKISPPNNFYHFDGGEDAIVEVILGCKICESRKSIIIERIQEINTKRSKKLDPVQLIQAKIHDSEFKIDLKERII